jgi:hypothetical protein
MTNNKEPVKYSILSRHAALDAAPGSFVSYKKDWIPCQARNDEKTTATIISQLLKEAS